MVSNITLQKYYYYLNLIVEFDRKKTGLHRFSWEAAQQQIPPDAVSVADKVEFNIFQIQTEQQSCFLLPQHLKLPLSKTARAVDKSSPPLLWKEPLKNKLSFSLLSVWNAHWKCSSQHAGRVLRMCLSGTGGKSSLGGGRRASWWRLCTLCRASLCPVTRGVDLPPGNAPYFCSLPSFSRNSVWGLELQAIFSQGLISWKGKIKLRLITFKWKWNQVTQSLLRFHFCYYFNCSGRSLNSFPAFSIFKFSNFFSPNLECFL